MTHPSSAPVNHTALREKLVWLMLGVQLTPASVVLRIRPASPTAHPVRPSGWKKTPFRLAPLAGLSWMYQPRAAGMTVTVAVSLAEPAEAISRAAPSPTPVTRPLPCTVNTPLLLLLQTTAGLAMRAPAVS